MQAILSESALLQQYNSFPQELQLAVSAYIELLSEKYNKLINTTTEKKKRQFGGLEGKIKVPADFNEPIVDFDEYMQ